MDHLDSNRSLGLMLHRSLDIHQMIGLRQSSSRVIDGIITACHRLGHLDYRFHEEKIIPGVWNVIHPPFLNSKLLMHYQDWIIFIIPHSWKKRREGNINFPIISEYDAPIIKACIQLRHIELFERPSPPSLSARTINIVSCPLREMTALVSLSIWVFSTSLKVASWRIRVRAAGWWMSSLWAW